MRGGGARAENGVAGRSHWQSATFAAELLGLVALSLDASIIDASSLSLEAFMIFHQFRSPKV